MDIATARTHRRGHLIRRYAMACAALGGRGGRRRTGGARASDVHVLAAAVPSESRAETDGLADLDMAG
jgi:hypothetical protein